MIYYYEVIKTEMHCFFAVINASILIIKEQSIGLTGVGAEEKKSCVSEQLESINLGEQI